MSLRKAAAAAAAASLISTGVLACTTTTTICEGKGCPATVASKHRTQICGPAGCQYYYWLYFSDGLFMQMAYSRWLLYGPGSYYGTIGGLYSRAGTTVYVTPTVQQENEEDGADGSEAAADADSESYEAVTEETSEAVTDEQDGVTGDSNPDGVTDPEDTSSEDDGDPDATEQESFDDPDSVSDDDGGFSDDDG